MSMSTIPTLSTLSMVLIDRWRIDKPGLVPRGRRFPGRWVCPDIATGESIAGFAMLLLHTLRIKDCDRELQIEDCTAFLAPA